MEEANVSTEGTEQTTAGTESTSGSEGGKNAAEQNKNAAEADAANQGESEEGDEGNAAEGEQTGNQTGSESKPASFLKVRYNHEDRDLNEDEARELAQKGIKYQSTIDKLDYAAALSGKTVKELVDEIVAKPEAEYRAKLEEMYGDDTESIEIGMRIYREQNKADYQKLLDTRAAEAAAETERAKKDISERLADEYIELKAEFPDAPEYEKLPDSVIRDAAGGKRDLLSAYLLWLRKQEKQIDAAKKAEEAAQSAGAGNMKSSGDTETFADLFTAGVWQK